MLSLPLVLTGLGDDPWHPVRDYAAADRGHPSTFFVVPFKDQPGVSPQGAVERRRAVAYDVGDIATDLQRAAGSRTEFALHGIDAWRDAGYGVERIGA